MLLVFVGIISVCYGSGGSFSYDDDSLWAADDNYCGLTAFQSPVDIFTAYAKDASCCGSAGLVSADSLHSIWSLEPQSMSFDIDKSDIHTLKLTQHLDTEITLTVGGIKYCYDGNLHFHWGEQNKGSEHKINHKQYALEGHYIHYNCEYDSIGSALEHWKSNGEHAADTPVLAVVGVFFEVSTTERNAAFDKILNSYQDSPTGIQINFFEDGLVPINDIGFYNYHGSTTTPKCYPTVNWIVSATSETIIHEDQLQQLRDYTGITTNYRSIQDSTQTIYKNTCLNDNGNGGGGHGNGNGGGGHGGGHGDGNSGGDDHSGGGGSGGSHNDCEEEDDDLPGQDEIASFIKQLEHACKDVDGLTDHEVFQDAIEGLLKSLPDLHDSDLFKKLGTFQAAALHAWQGLKHNCEEEAKHKSEQIETQRTGKQNIIKDIKRRSEKLAEHQYDKLMTILPHIHQLYSQQTYSKDCVDCESSSNEALSSIADKIDKLNLLGNQESKAKSKILDSLWAPQQRNDDQLKEIIKIINDKIIKEQQELNLFRNCVALATGKVAEFEDELALGGIHEQISEIEETAKSDAQSLTTELVQTLFGLQHGLDIDKILEEQAKKDTH